MPDWNAVYKEKLIQHATPADVLVLNEHLLPAKGRVLDFASGLCGNGIHLAKKGYDVSAWDLSDIAVEKINKYAADHKLSLQAATHDLENNLPDIKSQFDIVVVSYFLQRESLRYLYDVLKQGGLLFYQTFSGLQYQGQGPARDAFRLKQNELLSVFNDMQLLFYREDDKDSTGNGARQGQVMYVAKK
jgi:2-polyprenyl-3-methyl-5-hydroxy-6-metoxy-1,4-benzoquinol methylase